jgi:hypothetical protein
MTAFCADRTIISAPCTMDHARARAWHRDVCALQRGSSGQEGSFATLWMDREMSAGACSGLTLNTDRC